jgi:hypothetical protein
VGQTQTSEAALDTLYALGRRIRKTDKESELSDIEEEIDGILAAQRARGNDADEQAMDDTTLNVRAHRLQTLIHDRRAMLAAQPRSAPAV